MVHLIKRKEWTHQPRDALTTDTEDSNLYNEESVLPTLFYLEESNNKKDDPNESLSNSPSVEHNPEPRPPNEKSTKELTSEPDYDSISATSALTIEVSMRHLTLLDIMRYQKGSDLPRFSTL